MMDERGHAEVESEMIEGETVMQLRLNEGLSSGDFRSRTGVDPIAMFSESQSRLIDQGLLTVTASRLALTRSGRSVANRVMAELGAATSRSVLARL